MRFSTGSLISRRMFSVALVALAAVSVTGCDDPFSPFWDRGTYYLRYANNRPVPATVSYDAGAIRREVLGGSLTLRRDHSYQLVVEVREVLSGGRKSEYSVVYAGTYDNDHRTLYLTLYGSGGGWSDYMIANWRGGRIEVVVPEVDSRAGVLCLFED
ncbi:MAG: hypothetical protein FJ202_06895 [Gemmatimonadetes bacterium]|nr:hypothetical protein [Gemmatimonadota bacterium]